MEQTQHSDSRKCASGSRIQSPVSLAIFAIAILTMAAMALTLISHAAPIAI